jgi:hypothetical protein
MRSKGFLFTNIWTTLYTIGIFWEFFGKILVKYPAHFFTYQKLMFAVTFEEIGITTGITVWVTAILVLIYLNLCLYLVGTIVGWIGYAVKSSGAALCSAIMYLIGTICFPICILTGLPAIIVGFISYGNQKKLNAAPVIAK